MPGHVASELARAIGTHDVDGWAERVGWRQGGPLRWPLCSCERRSGVGLLAVVDAVEQDRAHECAGRDDDGAQAQTVRRVRRQQLLHDVGDVVVGDAAAVDGGPEREGGRVRGPRPLGDSARLSEVQVLQARERVARDEGGQRVERADAGCGDLDIAACG